MADFADLMTGGIPGLDQLMQQRAMQQAQAQQQFQQLVDRERQMQAINSPFVQQLMGGFTAGPSMPTRPDFGGPMMPGALSAADAITPNYPSKMGVDMPPGALRHPPFAGKHANAPPNSQAGDSPLVDIVMGEITRTPAGGSGVGGGPGGGKPQYDEKGRRVLEISGANWVGDKPKPERSLQGGRVGERPLNLKQGIRSTDEIAERVKSAMASGQLTPEQFAIFQQMLPQLTQMRVTEQQGVNAADRKYAELEQKNNQQQMRQGYDIWKTSVDTATKLRIAEQKLKAAASRPGSNRMLRELVPAMSNIRAQLEGENNRLSSMLGLGLGVSQNPAEQQALRASQARIAELMQASDAVTMQYTDLFNQSYGASVPTLRPTQPVPQAPPGQGRAPSGPAPGGLSPAMQKFLDTQG